jgi:uncharacterized membrane protein YdbT with pleckstrin-like domain
VTADAPEWVSLDPDEEVVWVGRPATATLYGTIATGVVLLPVGIGALILLAAPLSYLGIENTDYVVTTTSLYVKKGILSTNIETVDLDRIQNTEFNQSFWGDRFGYGKIAISTAGSSGSEMTFRGIPDAKTVRDRITELRSHGSRGSDGEDATEGTTPASADQIATLIEEVRATRAAFERVEERLADDPEVGSARAGEAGGDPAE